MVAGQRIDDDAVRDFVGSTDLVIAHNAAFERRFCERLYPVLIDKAWASSMSQVPWREEGIEGTKLFYVAYQQAFWFEGHRALDDCCAVPELLMMSLPHIQYIN